MRLFQDYKQLKSHLARLHRVYVIQKRAFNSKGSPGFLLVATIIAMTMIGGIALTFVTMVQREADMLGANTNQKTARQIAMTGMNRATKVLSGDGNWSDTPSMLFNAVSYSGGTYTVETSNASQDSITLKSTGVIGSAKEIILRAMSVDPDPNYPGFLNIDDSILEIDMSNIHAAGINLKEMYLMNARLYNDIVIDKIRISVPESPALSVINMHFKPPHGGWDQVWSGSALVGTLLDVDDTAIPPGESYEFRLKMDHNITHGLNTYILDIILSDASVYTASGTFNAEN